jgi:aminoglycoside 3-N-acetyltransferase
MISQKQLTQQLVNLGITPGGVLLLQDGRLTRCDYAEIDHCCQNFNLVDAWLEAKKLQRRGKVGQAEARLARSRDIVNVVTKRLQSNETIFLHPVGVDEECDEARASLLS